MSINARVLPPYSPKDPLLTMVSGFSDDMGIMQALSTIMTNKPDWIGGNIYKDGQYTEIIDIFVYKCDAVGNMKVEFVGEDFNCWSFLIGMKILHARRDFGEFRIIFGSTDGSAFAVHPVKGY